MATTIIIGLGNPGAKFSKTRHNVGFMALDKFAKENNFPEFVLDKKFEAEVSEGIIGDKKIILAKPQTFMNASGKTAREILKANKSQLDDFIIVHDDIDLPFGRIKIVKERGSAGHKGVESIIKNIGNDGLIRFRIGIKGQKNVDAIKIVLKKFTKDEEALIKQAIEETSQALTVFLNEGFEKAMNGYN